MSDFLEDLDRFVALKMSELDQLKEQDVQDTGGGEVVRRLKIALKNELEASELAASWMPTTPELDVKLGLARQAGDEARHYAMIEDHIRDLGANLADFDPAAGGHTPMFELLSGFTSTVERVAAGQFTREALALKKNEQFIEFCDAVGASATAALYRDQIQPDEGWHVRLGRQTLERYAVTDEEQHKARAASEAVLALAFKIQAKQLHEMNISHAPGC